MLARRIVPRLDVAGSRVVKGVHFEGLRDAGTHGLLAASILHFEGCTLSEARAHLHGRSFPVRP